LVGKSPGIINFLIIGKGKWSKTYLREIDLLNINYTKKIFSARDLQKLINSKSDFLKSFLVQNKISIIIFATTPSAQYQILREMTSFKGQIILEKPLFINNEQECFYQELKSSLRNKILVNHFHFFSKNFLKFFNSMKEISPRRIHIYDYSNGPFREILTGLEDWGPHPIGIVHSLCDSPKLIKAKRVKFKNLEKWFIKYQIDNDKSIKIITGNGFRNKKRIIKFFDDGNKEYEFNLENNKKKESTIKNLLLQSIDNFNKQESSFFKAIDTYNLALRSSSEINRVQKISNVNSR
jgi:hypothetical protein